MKTLHTKKLSFLNTSFLELQQKNGLRLWYQAYNRVEFIDISPSIKTNYNVDCNYLLLYRKPEVFIFNKQKKNLNHLKKTATIKKTSSDINNMAAGISGIFKKKLILRGRAFYWKVNWKYIQAKVTYVSGFMRKFTSNLVRQPRLLDTKVKVSKIKTRRKGLEKATIKIYGHNFYALNQLVSNIRKLKKPNFFTGVGIRYTKDIIPDRAKQKLLVMKNKGKKTLPSAVIIKYKSRNG